MRPFIPPYVTPIVLALVFGLAVWLGRVVFRAAEAADLTPVARRRVTLTSAVVLGAWLVLALASAPSTIPVDATGRSVVPIAFPLFGGGAFLLVVGALILSDTWRRTVAAIPVERLVATQVFRLIGLIFIPLWAIGTLPAHFALPAGWGDVAVGITAPLAALALARRVRGARLLGLAWNTFGLIDLLSAVGLGTGYLLLLFRPGTAIEPAGALTAYPLVLIPTFAVPLGIILHLLTFRALAARSAAPQGGPVALSPHGATAR
ncbi:MAG TPA: hypothetical protein VIE46_08845 [Gemmatimonadales bacterium]